MSKEVLSKNTAGVFSSIIRKPNWDKVQLQEEIKQILGQARESVGSPEEYLEAILGNVTFQYAHTNTAVSFLTKCIDEEQFFPQESFLSIMENVPSQVQESNFLAENMPRFKELVYKGTTIEEQVVHAEMVYLHTKLVNDLFVEFVGTFTYPENRDFMGNFMEYSSEVVVDTVMHYCQTYSNHMLEELSSIPSTK